MPKSSTAVDTRRCVVRVLWAPMSFRRGVLFLGVPVVSLSGVLLVFEQYGTALVVAGLASFAFAWAQYIFTWYKRQSISDGRTRLRRR
jgi:hypothetical protein